MPSPDSKEMLIKNNDDFKVDDKDPKVPAWAALILILLVLGHFGLVYLIIDVMPTPLTIADEVNRMHKKNFEKLVTLIPLLFIFIRNITKIYL